MGTLHILFQGHMAVSDTYFHFLIKYYLMHFFPLFCYILCDTYNSICVVMNLAFRLDFWAIGMLCIIGVSLFAWRPNVHMCVCDVCMCVCVCIMNVCVYKMPMKRTINICILNDTGIYSILLFW